jgi:hypothetical protein
MMSSAKHTKLIREELGEVKVIHQDAGDPAHSVVVKLAKWVDDTSEG